MLLNAIFDAVKPLSLEVSAAFTAVPTATIASSALVPALIAETWVKSIAFTFTSFASAPMVKVSLSRLVPVSSPLFSATSLMLLNAIFEAVKPLSLEVSAAFTAEPVTTISWFALVPALIADTWTRSIAFTLTALSAVVIVNVSLFASVPVRDWLTRSAVSIFTNW